jgi:hypothetical protein
MPLAARGYWHEASEALAVRGIPGGLGLGQEPSGSRAADTHRMLPSSYMQPQARVGEVTSPSSHDFAGLWRGQGRRDVGRQAEQERYWAATASQRTTARHREPT